MDRMCRSLVAGLLAAFSLCLAACGGSGGSGSPPPVQTQPPPAPFTATVGSAALTVAQSGRHGVWVNVKRDPSFTGAVTVTLSGAPEGVSGPTLTVDPLASSALFVIRAAPDLAVGGPLDLTLVASGGGTSLNLPITLTVTAVAPTATSLIAADLAAGTIDYPTSLLYRGYALYGDSRLPAQYAGGVDPKDDSFFIEASRADLPADVAQALAPYLARPSDPASWFAQGAAPAASGGSPTVRRGLKDPATSPCTTNENQVEYNGWKSELYELAGGGSVRFWVQCHAGETEFEDTRLAYMTQIAGPVADQEVSLMGPPVPDYGLQFFGTDTAIDVYLIDECAQDTPVRADGTTLCATASETGTILGAATQTTAFGTPAANTCSDFITIDASGISDGSFKSTFAHEFFHVLQDAYSCNTGGEFGGSNEFWFREASAVWAEANFVPETALTEVHSRFKYDFQPSTKSLHTSGSAGGAHMYAAYIWPYFYMQKKGGGAASVLSAWKALAGVQGEDAANSALDKKVYNFQGNFRDFAVTNINYALPDALPQSALYQALAAPGVEPASFPFGEPPIWATTFTDVLTASTPLDIKALAANYSRFTVTGTKVKKLKFTFSDIVMRDGLDIDAILKINNQPWKRQAYDGADVVKFCLDKPDQNLNDSYWVLSNHNVPMAQHVQGVFKVEASDVACGDSWSGTADSTFGYTMHASVTWVFDDVHSTATVAMFYPTGTVSFTSPNCTVTPGSATIQPAEGSLQIDYSTTPATYRASGTTVWEGTYTCGGGSFQAGAGGVWLSDFNQVPPAAVGTVPAVNKNGNTVLAGSSTSPGYTFSWSFTDD